MTLREIRENTAKFIDTATNIVATIDSRPVRNVRRARSAPFASVFPADNILIAGCGNNNPAGVYSPTAADGYYGYIESLSPGEHTLQFSGTAGAFNLNVVYQLTVVPVSLH